MRQLSPPTNIVLTVLAALGLLGCLRLPWYAPAPAPEPGDEYQGSLEAFASGVLRVFDSPTQTLAGSDAMARGETLLLVLVGITMLLAAAMAAQPLRGFARGMLRLVPLTLPVFVVVHMLDRPEGAGELRWGSLVSLAVALFAASSGWNGATLLDRRAAPAPYRPTAPPPSYTGR